MFSMLLNSLCLLVLYICTVNCEIIVNTTNGPIRGIIATTNTKENKIFYAFQGIPYAAPPVQQLRFKSPRCHKKWQEIYNATAERSMCVQTQNNTIMGSEDCLFLNIYTPQINPNETIATIVWIHGGGFLWGNGNLGLNGADYFMLNKVIVVSINYRLGVFGFLSTKDPAATGNWGLKDQIHALKWIKRNIVNFGGDPNNVTIMGESAGAASVNFLIESDRARGLFKGAIAESGTSLNPWSWAPNARQLAFRIGLANLIVTFNSADLVDKLRSVPARQLQKSTGLPTILDLFDPLNGLPFSPVWEDDQVPDAVVTKYSYEARKNGNFNRVPLLNGFNSLEARIANKLPWYGLFLLEQYNLDSSKLTPSDMNATKKGDEMVGQNIKAYYFQNRPITEGAKLINFLDDDEFIRGIVKTSEFHSQYAKCYLYEFSFIGSIQHVAFNPEGVAHAEELDFIWENEYWQQTSPAAKLTVERMVGMWSNFAKYGNPTYAQNSAINVTWPEYNSSMKYYLDIDEELVPRCNPRAEQMRLWDNWYQRYGHEPFNSY